MALAETAQLVLVNGIVVNEFCEASIPGVYAAGDVASFHSTLAGRNHFAEVFMFGLPIGAVIAGFLELMFRERVTGAPEGLKR